MATISRVIKNGDGTFTVFNKRTILDLASNPVETEDGAGAFIWTPGDIDIAIKNAQAQIDSFNNAIADLKNQQDQILKMI